MDALGSEHDDPFGGARRLAALDSFGILDTPPEQDFDGIVTVAAHTCETPVALVSFVSFDRQWFKARVGFEACETPLSQSVCSHVVQERRLLVINDLTADPRTCDNTLVTGDPHIRFYAGAPIETESGDILGAVCVIDTVPRPQGLTPGQASVLSILARQVMAQLALRRLVAARTAERDRAWKLAQDLLVIARADGSVLAVNTAWSNLLGWSERDLIGQTIDKLAHPDDTVVPIVAMVDRRECRLRHRDGTYRWFAWTGAIEDEKIYANGRDTTDTHLQASMLAQAEDQLRQSQKMEAVGQLTGGLAHDFNNLLTSIGGSLEMLETRIAQGRTLGIDRYVTAAQGAARRAAALTQRLLAFSRQQTLDPKPTDVNRLIAGMEDLVRRTVGPGVEVGFTGASGIWPTLIDQNQLENALLNLCINARDAMAGNGRIEIATDNATFDATEAAERDLLPGKYIDVRVSDTGTGMEPALIARIFDPFFTTKPIGVGTGLGLSMVYGFVRQSGGQVRVHSEPGRGTTMCLNLPAHEGAIEAETLRAPPPATASGAGKRVLVVDDEPIVRMLIVESLEDAGYAVIEASDGRAGLAILESAQPVDMLLTDVGLPGGMNGRQLADLGRSLRPSMKILFITGYAEKTALGDGPLPAGTEVLHKPFDINSLIRKLSSL